MADHIQGELVQADRVNGDKLTHVSLKVRTQGSEPYRVILSFHLQGINLIIS